MGNAKIIPAPSGRAPSDAIRRILSFPRSITGFFQKDIYITFRNKYAKLVHGPAMHAAETAGHGADASTAVSTQNWSNGPDSTGFWKSRASRRRRR